MRPVRVQSGVSVTDGEDTARGYAATGKESEPVDPPEQPEQRIVLDPALLITQRVVRALAPLPHRRRRFLLVVVTVLAVALTFLASLPRLCRALAVARNTAISPTARPSGLAVPSATEIPSAAAFVVGVAPSASASASVASSATATAAPSAKTSTSVTPKPMSDDPHHGAQSRPPPTKIIDEDKPVF